MTTFPRPGVRTGIFTAKPILRDAALDDFFGFCDVVSNSQDRLLTVAWREALTAFPSYSAMLEVIRAAMGTFETAMAPEHGVVHHLARSTTAVEHPTTSVSAPDQTTTSRLGVRGRRLAQRFLICKHKGGTGFTNAAEINEAIRRVGWDATLIAANLSAYCEAAEQSQFWGRGDEQGQLPRHQMFSDWQDKAGESAREVKDGMEELDRCVVGFAEKYQIVVD